MVHISLIKYDFRICSWWLVGWQLGRSWESISLQQCCRQGQEKAKSVVCDAEQQADGLIYVDVIHVVLQLCVQALAMLEKD